MQSKTKLKLDFVTVTDILLIVEKGIKREICHSVYQYAKEYNKYVKDYGNSIFWIKDTSQFNEYFIKTIMKKVMEDIFLKLILNTEKLHELHNDLLF